MSNYESGKDFTEHDGVIRGKGGANATFRGLQADLNDFASTVGFEAVKVDGALGSRTVTAFQGVYQAVLKQNPGLGGSIVPPTTSAEIAQHAVAGRMWLESTARKALGLSELRRYHQGSGKEWNVKDAIAYGAGPVHDDFKALQAAVNRFAGPLGFQPLDHDGFLGDHTVKAINTIYQAVIAKHLGLSGTAFPPPDAKEEVAEYAQFIRRWLETTAARALLVEAGA